MSNILWFYAGLKAELEFLLPSMQNLGGFYYSLHHFIYIIEIGKFRVYVHILPMPFNI